jgi:glycosyltransferase involved in cell wall biosynthesis
VSGILVFFHCPSNTGYAIAHHESAFSQMAVRLVGSFEDVHFAYPSLEAGRSRSLPPDVRNVLRFDSKSSDPDDLLRIREYVREHGIVLAFGFDQPVHRPSYRHLREAGVRHIVSYLGAPMSSVNSGVKLALKKLMYRMRRDGPDHFIFQSEGMRKTATHGVGIPRRRTSVVRSGVDVETFKPASQPTWYAHDLLGISRTRRIVFYSGHMERRKGVHVIVRAAAYLVNHLRREDLHFIFLGNRPGEEEAFHPLFKGTPADGHISFLGYRHDVAELQRGSDLAVIATTGWDSHTMTAVEVAASGLPLIVSDIAGLRETVTEATGMTFPIGDHEALAHRIALLADNPALRREMGQAARDRVLSGHTLELQISGLEEVVRSVIGGAVW